MLYNWEVSGKSSFIEFRIKYYKIGRITGKFLKFNGEIIAGCDFENPKIDFRLEVNSISTLNKDWDYKLISKHFLNAAEYPVIDFYADGGCRFSSGGVQELTGKLCINDRSQVITLVVMSSIFKKNAKVPVFYFNLATTFFLTDFGFAVSENIYGNEVQLSIRVKLSRTSAIKSGI